MFYISSLAQVLADQSFATNRQFESLPLRHINSYKSITYNNDQETAGCPFWVALFVPVAVLVAVRFSSGCLAGFAPEISSTAL